jgi:hypothetical protein
MGFPFIVGIAPIASLLVPIGMAFLAPPNARRATFAAWGVLLPVLGISCGAFASQGERGFLSTSQAVNMGALLMAVSFGVGYGASTVFHARSSSKSGP